MDSNNLKKALAILASLLNKQTAQEKALKTTGDQIEKQKIEVAKLVTPKAT